MVNGSQISLVFHDVQLMMRCHHRDAYDDGLIGSDLNGGNHDESLGENLGDLNDANQKAASLMMRNAQIIWVAVIALTASSHWVDDEKMR